jgi:hypothetical protein
MSRLTIDLTDQQHQTLKALAALQGKTIKDYATEKLFPSQSDEETALEQLKALLQQRISQATSGELESRDITEIATDLLDLPKNI